MFRIKSYSLFWIALLALTALAIPTAALAGGWVVVTLDELPGPITAGQPITVGMTARQHGRTAWEVKEIPVHARHVETGRELTFSAKPGQTRGHYEVELLFPEAGRWEWGVESGMLPPVQPMPALLVAAEGAPSTASAGSSLPGASNTARLLGLGALVSFAAGAVLIARGQKKRASFLAGVGLIVLFGGLAAASVTTARASTQQLEAAVIPQTADGASTGRQLFLAKGCVVCHVNDRAIKGSAQYGVDFGPNLTTYANDPVYLRSFLKDPDAMRPGIEMPNLELKEAEINALVEFLNSEE